MTEGRACPSSRAIAAIAIAISLSVPATSARAQGPPPKILPGRYVVVYQNWVANPAGVAAQMAWAHGATFDHVYGAALKGCAGVIPPGRLAAIRNDPRVAYVEPDQVFEVQGKLEVLGKPGGGGGSTAEVVPSGVRRIYGSAPIPATVDVNVAVLDTGIQSNHPDLNVIAGVDFTGNRRGWEDGNGHGTHVSGTIAAKNNGIGVVGVAPGANLYAVKVLDDRGSGQNSWVIAGLDWLVANAAANNIRVANMSLGGGYSQAILDAVDNAVAGGVTFAVAAGNSSTDCRGTSPANSLSDGVLTVSALSDSNDVFANFSNNGRNETGYDSTGAVNEPPDNGVDVIAPGVNIYSTYKGSGYATMSGTSMASPHAAGVAALAVASQSSATATPTPAEVKLALLTSPGTGGWYSYVYGPDGRTYYYGLRPWRAVSGDFDSGYDDAGYEPLINAGAFVP